MYPFIYFIIAEISSVDRDPEITGNSTERMLIAEECLRKLWVQAKKGGSGGGAFGIHFPHELCWDSHPESSSNPTSMATPVLPAQQLGVQQTRGSRVFFHDRGLEIAWCCFKSILMTLPEQRQVQGTHPMSVGKSLYVGWIAVMKICSTKKSRSTVHHYAIR